MKRRVSLIILFAHMGVQIVCAQVNYAQYVNPFIGTGGHGHTFPGAVLPFGMMQLSPDTRVDGSWDGCSGYHYSDSLIYGFSHTHLSGTGCSDWGDILLMPTTDAPSMDNKVYASSFSHASERAMPGFYEVILAKNNIKAQLTTTLRTGIHRYFFPGHRATLLLDLLHRDKTLDCTFQVVDSVTVVGYRLSSAWAQKQRVYFAMRFSKPVKKMEYAIDKQFKPLESNPKDERREGAYFQFDLDKDSVLLVKVAISAVSEKGALKNLEAEAKHWNFETYKTEAEKAWNWQLQKVEVAPDELAKSNNLSPNPKMHEKELTIFYTALYHCFIHPSLYMDTDGQYRGRDEEVHAAKGFTNYTVFSLWDTYRALNPLLTILEPRRTGDFINSFLMQYRQSGRLPMWELSGNETDCMIGFHAVSVITDAMVKGIGGFDQSLAYEAMKAASNYSAFSIPIFNQNGFLQVEDENESVSKSLEYGYDDWCISRAAALLNKREDEQLYLKRSLGYRNLFDATVGFMRPRKNGNWLFPFSGAEVNNHFTEGNSWQYSFYVPQDMEGLIKLHGGAANFEKKLDELFTTREKNRGREQADVTGLIGQYAHGNEPSHHIAYLYNFVGKPNKTQERVREIRTDFYTDKPDGLIGNEDCGQMSAWYVFSALGIYPVCPGQPHYVLGEPLFENLRLNLDNGKSFSITASPASGKAIAGTSINGVMNQRSAISHTAIVNGGQLRFLYEDKNAVTRYGKGINGPPVIINKESIVASPLIRSSERIFSNKVEISILPLNPDTGLCVYTLDGSEPLRSSTVYTKPFFINANCTIKARTYQRLIESNLVKKERQGGQVRNELQSSVISARFYKIKYPYGIILYTRPGNMYMAEGANSLIDGIMGTVDWRKGDWMGFQEKNVEAVIDLGETKEVSYLSFNCLQDSRAWIVLPNRVNFYASEDNVNFTLIAIIKHTVKAEDNKVQIHKFEQQLDQPQKLRYLKIIAVNYGTLPHWHEGKGGKPFIFVDELEIK